MATDPTARSAALSSLQHKRAFQKQVRAYCIVNLTLVLIWWADGMGDFWPIWPMAGWGVALAIHWWRLGHPERPITEAEIMTEMERLQR